MLRRTFIAWWLGLMAGAWRACFGKPEEPAAEVFFCEFEDCSQQEREYEFYFWDHEQQCYRGMQTGRILRTETGRPYCAYWAARSGYWEIVNMED